MLRCSELSINSPEAPLKTAGLGGGLWGDGPPSVLSLPLKGIALVELRCLLTSPK